MTMGCHLLKTWREIAPISPGREASPRLRHTDRCVNVPEADKAVEPFGVLYVLLVAAALVRLIW
jgi:hypothetical protein